MEEQKQEDTTDSRTGRDSPAENRRAKNIKASSAKDLGSGKKKVDPERRKEIEQAVRVRLTVEKLTFKTQEKLIDGVSEAELEKLKRYLQPSHYEDVVTERCCDKKCGYPCCGNPLVPRPQDQQPKYRISLSQKKIFDVTESYQYCSEPCLINSKLFASTIDHIPVHLRPDIIAQNRPDRLARRMSSPAGLKHGPTVGTTSAPLVIHEKPAGPSQPIPEPGSRGSKGAAEIEGYQQQRDFTVAKPLPSPSPSKGSSNSRTATQKDKDTPDNLADKASTLSLAADVEQRLSTSQESRDDRSLHVPGSRPGGRSAPASPPRSRPIFGRSSSMLTKKTVHWQDLNNPTGKSRRGSTNSDAAQPGYRDRLLPKIDEAASSNSNSKNSQGSSARAPKINTNTSSQGGDGQAEGGDTANTPSGPANDSPRFTSAEERRLDRSPSDPGMDPNLDYLDGIWGDKDGEEGSSGKDRPTREEMYAQLSPFAQLWDHLAAWCTPRTVELVTGTRSADPHDRDMDSIQEETEDVDGDTLHADRNSAPLSKPDARRQRATVFIQSMSRSLTEIGKTLGISSAVLELGLAQLVQTLSFHRVLPAFSPQQWTTLAVVLLHSLALQDAQIASAIQPPSAAAALQPLTCVDRDELAVLCSLLNPSLPMPWSQQPLMAPAEP